MNSEQRRSRPGGRSVVRGRLIESACRLIEDGGAASATSRAIADGAGENLASITYYFGSKDQLIAEAMVAAARRLIVPITEILADPALDPVGKLQRAVATLIEILETNRDRLNGYLASLAAGTHNDAIRSEVNDLHRGLADALADSIREQKREGLVPGWIEPEAVAQLMVSLAVGVAVGAAVDPERTDPVAIAAQFAQMLLAAGAGPSPSAGSGT